MGDFEGDSYADVDVRNNLIINPGRSQENYMSIRIGRQTLSWYTDWGSSHPDCSKSSWELRIYHNTPREQCLALFCGDCGKTVDPAEIINALIQSSSSTQ